MKPILFFLGLLLLWMCISCERDSIIDTDTDTATPIEMAGEWEVMASIHSEPIFEPFKVVISVDSTTNGDSIIIQDSEIKFWDFKVKAAIDPKNSTFETRLSQCEMSDKSIGIKIPIGKLLNPDSIYFEIQFEDDEIPYGNTYQLKGHRTNQ